MVYEFLIDYPVSIYFGERAQRNDLPPAEASKQLAGLMRFSYLTRTQTPTA